ncbi:MAG: hypothetical protein H2039_00815 [Brevundimonas sp.]|nr:hypothetical protein [Brevundimonas sp.]
MTSTTNNAAAALILASYIAAPVAVPASRYVPTAHRIATPTVTAPRQRSGAIIIPGTLDG